MARIVRERDGAGVGDGVDSIGGGGLCTAPPDSSTMIDKTYQPNEVEGRIYAAWEDAQAFRAGRPERAQATPYSIVIPPPNVTGSLHMGHALNNTLQDVLTRWRRAQGYNALWMPGTDHAGIATQAVVERRLREEERKTRHDLGREEVVRRIWEWQP